MLNPIAYTERIVSDFLRYQITAYPFSDPDFYEQMRTLLSLEQTRDTPLLKGPYISLSQSFRHCLFDPCGTRDRLVETRLT